jgi:tetratricopeptide (TPR) repeat protein
MRQRDYDRAFADAEESIGRNPADSNGFLLRANTLTRTARHTRALADFDEAIRISPNNAIAYANRCGALVAVGHDLQAAVSDCDKALQLMPHMNDALSNRGFAYLKLGQFDQAIVDFSAVIARSPGYYLALYGRGVAKRKKGDIGADEADISAARALKAEVDDVVAEYFILR